MRESWIIAYYEVLKYSRMRSVLVVLIALPLLLILLLGSAFDSELKPAKVAVFIDDQGELRSSMDAFWRDDKIKSYINLIAADSRKDVENFVREGIADYGVFVPADFSKRFIAGETTKWLTYSGRYGEKNMAVEAVVNSFMISANLQIATITPLGSDRAIVVETHHTQAAANSSAVIVETLESGQNKVFGGTTAIQYYSAAYLIMFLLYGGMTAGIALLDQKSKGTLQRMYVIPTSFRAVVFGIIAGAVMLAALQAIIIILFTNYVYGVDWGGHYDLITLICLLTTTAGAGLSIIIASIVGSIKTMQSLFTIISFIMAFISGGMAPEIENMVGGANGWTINYWANVSLRSIMNEMDTSLIWKDIGMLALIVFILSALAVMRLPKVVKNHA
jgi:ABC-2 type transport system permease protein